jgi:hypothetical protein
VAMVFFFISTFCFKIHMLNLFLFPKFCLNKPMCITIVTHVFWNLQEIHSKFHWTSFVIYHFKGLRVH